MKRTNRILSLILAIVMMICVLPVTAFAACDTPQNINYVGSFHTVSWGAVNGADQYLFSLYNANNEKVFTNPLLTTNYINLTDLETVDYEEYILPTGYYYAVVHALDSSVGDASLSEPARSGLFFYENPNTPITLTYHYRIDGIDVVYAYYANNAEVTVAECLHTHSGKVFKEWNTESDGSGTDYKPGDTFTITEDMTLYAQWSDPLTVTYDANGGTGTVPEDNNLYASGDKVVYAEPTGLTGPDGKVFVYWATNPNGNTNIWYPGEETITQNMYLYAIWRNPQISVTYSANGEDVSVPVDTNKYDTKENITVKAPVDTVTPGNEKVFTGWNTKADGSGTTYQAGDTFKLYWLEDVTLYAMWTEAVTVTYMANGGTGTPPETAILAKGSSYVFAYPDGLTPPEDKVFYLWGESPEGGNNFHDTVNEGTVNEDMTLYAIWRNSRITVTYDANGESVNVPTDSAKYDENETITVKAPIETLTSGNEKIFTGWNTKADGSGTTYQAEDTFSLSWAEDVTLYAQWSEAVTVTYMANGGTGTPPEPAIVARGSRIVFASPDNLIPPDGKVFKWWGSAPNGGNNLYGIVAENTVYDDIVLYAVWEDAPMPTSHTITVQTKGSGTASASVASAVKGTNITLTAIPADGWYFKEWIVVSGGIAVSGNEFTMPDNAVEIKAVFEETPPPSSGLQIYIVPESGETVILNMEPADSIENVKQRIQEDTGISPAKQILVFGKMTLEDGRTLADYNIRNGDTLHLSLTADSFTISVSVSPAAGGGTVTGEGSYAPGEQVTITATPDTASGYCTAGWGLAAVGGGVIPPDEQKTAHTFIMPEKDVALSVAFVQHSYVAYSDLGNGTHQNKCLYCQIPYGDPEAHADETGAGSSREPDGICDLCDADMPTDPDPHIHSYGTLQYDADNHWQECSCGDKSNVTAHGGGTETCTAKAKCMVCGTEYGKLLDHKYEWVTDREAGTAAPGLKHEECTACGARRSEGTVIPQVTTPPTGDGSNIVLWFCLLFMSGIGIAATVLLGRKKAR